MVILKIIYTGLVSFFTNSFVYNNRVNFIFKVLQKRIIKLSIKMIKSANKSLLHLNKKFKIKNKELRIRFLYKINSIFKKLISSIISCSVFIF